MTRTSRPRAGLAGVLALVVAGCATASVTNSGGPDIATAQAERYDGPKARIAVATFTNRAHGGGWSSAVGDGMTDMTATALFNSNRFIVLERQNLHDVLREQDLGRSGRVRADTAAPTGQLEGAELLVTGAVTEFAPNTSGAGASTGIANSVITGVAGGFRQSRVAIDVRVVDARTGRLLSAATVSGQANDFDLSRVGFSTRYVGGNLGAFNHTPMDAAIRIAVDEAVKFIVARTPAEYYRHP